MSSITVEVGEEIVSYGRDVARIEATCRKTRQGAPVTIEVGEEIVSYGGDVTRVEASVWEGC